MRVFFAALAVLFLVLAILAPQTASADQLELKDGRRIQGIVKKIENGQVTVEVGPENRSFSILEIGSMEFDTPHALSKRAEDHLADHPEAQEIVIHVREVEKAAADIRNLMAAIRKEWSGRTAIPGSEVAEWNKTRDRFDRALNRYQEVLDDLYAHVLQKVDDYTALTKEANELYIGVRGLFNVGSALVPKKAQHLPLKKYVPSNWYDTIYYDAYSRGYNDAYWGESRRNLPQ